MVPTTGQMMRPRINAGDDTRDAVERYANDHGLKVSQAWAEIVEAGIEAKGYDTHD